MLVQTENKYGTALSTYIFFSYTILYHFHFSLLFITYFTFLPHNAEQMLVSLCNYSAFVSVDIISACGQPINCSVAPVLARVICPCFVVVTVTGTRLRLPGGRVPERPFWATEGIENMAFVITELFVDT